MFYRDRDAFLYHGRFLLRVADLMRACTFKKTGRQEFFQDILSFDQGYAFLDKNSCPVWYYYALVLLRLRLSSHSSQLSYCSEHARCGSQFFLQVDPV